MRCLIVDDNVSFRDAARRMLGGGGITVVAVAANSGEALRLCRELRPDVALVDVALGAESGFELAEQLHRTELPPAVILISTYAEQDLTEMIAASPAVGFVPKFALSAAAVSDVLATAIPDR
ncbi:response regulator transcription factor [Mycobacterium sp. 21AC1]|uniref:LytR/AlgR family response regulator transcription factor n=1 Tax=[Mycobacterium] appelbergii TaxID=2939269 RepID=UPI002938F531|nr:response regulator transcription factor [Mycobacterium sp. 21AC1]MDV3125530.1 response regulator transcription factor [Mycobacterium sp. 21AC1]